MKIIVVGAVQFTLEMLKIIQQSDHDVVGVITSEGAGVASDHADLSPF